MVINSFVLFFSFFLSFLASLVNDHMTHVLCTSNKVGSDHITVFFQGFFSANKGRRLVFSIPRVVRDTRVQCYNVTNSGVRIYWLVYHELFESVCR